MMVLNLIFKWIYLKKKSNIHTYVRTYKYTYVHSFVQCSCCTKQQYSTKHSGAAVCVHYYCMTYCWGFVYNFSFFSLCLFFYCYYFVAVAFVLNIAARWEFICKHHFFLNTILCSAFPRLFPFFSFFFCSFYVDFTC